MSSINLEEYRHKHKRCRYCKYNGYIGGGGQRVYNWCHAKNRHKYEWILLSFISNIQGCFCSVYESREV